MFNSIVHLTYLALDGKTYKGLSEYSTLERCSDISMTGAQALPPTKFFVMCVQKRVNGCRVGARLARPRYSVIFVGVRFAGPMSYAHLKTYSRGF